MRAQGFFTATQSDLGKVRKNNEDSLLVVDIIHVGRVFHLVAVADGMGGGSRGEDASRIALDAMVRSIVSGRWRDPEEALRAAFHCANAEVFAEGTGHGEAPRSLMGTTLVAVMIDGQSGETWVGNVGDSRAYVHRSGVLVQMTEDHSVFAEQMRAGLSPENATQAARWRSALTRAIGLAARVEPDVLRIAPLAEGDCVLLCSDGLHGMLNDPRMGRIMDRTPFTRLPTQFVKAANKAGGHDNITVAVGCYGHEPSRPLPGTALRRRLLPCRDPSLEWNTPGAASVLAVLVVTIVLAISWGVLE